MCSARNAVREKTLSSWTHSHSFRRHSLESIQRKSPSMTASGSTRGNGSLISSSDEQVASMQVASQAKKKIDAESRVLSRSRFSPTPSKAKWGTRTTEIWKRLGSGRYKTHTHPRSHRTGQGPRGDLPASQYSGLTLEAGNKWR